MHNQTPPPPPPQQPPTLQPPPPPQHNPVQMLPNSIGGVPASHRNITNIQTQEMSIPNDLIGCIIGRGGQKISEIRLVSGANIKIADLEDGNPDRHVSITGTAEQIQLAQFLINARYDITFYSDTRSRALCSLISSLKLTFLLPSQFTVFIFGKQSPTNLNSKLSN